MSAREAVEEQIPFGNGNKESKDKGEGRSRFSAGMTTKRKVLRLGDREKARPTRRASLFVSATTSIIADGWGYLCQLYSLVGQRFRAWRGLTRFLSGAARCATASVS